MVSDIHRSGLDFPGRRRHFYRGVGPAVLRGIPCNACLFLVYEQIVRAWPV